ncbi:MAG: hypothetical protein KF712_07135 [Akkermansiaceae bacterium]|nr:hypothetical protein [Akkermansiaceae bacterium]
MNHPEKLRHPAFPRSIMKTIFSLLCVLSFLPPLHAATWTVDNNTSRPANFRTIQAAINAAAVGDTVLIAASSTTYSGFTLTKRLNLIGPGDTMAGGGRATVERTIAITSVTDVLSPDYGRNAGGTRIEGLVITEGDSAYNSLTISSACSHVVIKRCSLGYFSSNGSHTMILSCWFSKYLTINGANSSIIGSHFRGTNTYKEGFLVENCIIRDGYINSSFPPILRNTILINQNETGSYSGATYDHCMSLGPKTLPAGNGNINLIYSQAANVFTNFVPSDYSSWSNLQLKEGSQARGAGRNGVDMGIYAGSSPYVPGYVPALPRVNALVLPSVVPDSSGLTFEISAEARD